MALAAPKLVEPKSRRKPATKAVATPKPDHLKLYANTGVAIMSVLSALLNGYANAAHAEVVWAGWAMGLAIPVIILILSKVASLLWKRGDKQPAKITAGVGIGLLLLSVWHCAVSISALTGSPFILALPMAVAIDCGFVCCEWAAIQD